MSAPDIFLSYNREDSARAKHFADGFAAQGFDVWWDVALRSGEAYDKVTEDALRNAKAVVVLWSPRSVDSRWVRAEATLADRRKTLMPAMIEPCERPIMFELVQTAELSHWQGDAGDAAWKSFAEHVREFIGKEALRPAVLKPAEPMPSLNQLSVAVLPFANMGKDEEQEYFADGITEDVITDLGKVSALSVIARNTAFTFKDQLVDVQKVARQLNVTHVLEGSVRRAGNRVRVNVQLIDGSSGSQVWSERWDRDLDDIFELQDELSQAIVKALKVKLLPKEKKAIEDRGTDSVEAYDLFMRARAAASNANGIAATVEAYELYKQALEIDPQFTLAQAGLAAQAQQTANATDEIREQLQADLRAHYEKAVVHSPEGWATQTLLAMCRILEGDGLSAFDPLEKALANAPFFNTDLVSTYASQLAYVGRMDEALELFDAARRTDPYSALISIAIQLMGLSARRFDEVKAEYERNRRAGWNREEVEHNFLFLVWLEGDAQATKRQYRRFLDTRAIPIPEIDSCIDYLERHDAALEIIRMGMASSENRDGIRQFLLGLHAALHGDPELALVGVRRAVLDLQNVFGHLIWYPFLAEMRQLPEFKQFIRDLGIYDYWRSTGHWGDFARPKGDDDFEIIA